MNKVVFLDIDGVLVNRKSLIQHQGRRSVGDPECVANLNLITDQTQAKLVLSSTWRHDPIGFDSLKLLFKSWGVTGEFIGTTTLEHEGFPTRGSEIALWLKENLFYGNFIILDDDSDMNELLPFLIKTTFEKGLTAKEVTAAIRRLEIDLITH